MLFRSAKAEVGRDGSYRVAGGERVKDRVALHGELREGKPHLA
ncbi:hypothetical protein [Terriglobus roseus]|nr:hypothetical protein [Terriglobus roseus]